jgi:hypothetical protein
VIKEKIRELIEETRGNTSAAIDLFGQWLQAGGEERLLVLVEELTPEVTGEARTLHRVIAQAIEQAKTPEQARDIIAEGLDPRENPTAHGTVAREARVLLAGVLMRMFGEATVNWKQEHPDT